MDNDDWYFPLAILNLLAQIYIGKKEGSKGKPQVKAREARAP